MADHADAIEALDVLRKALEENDRAMLRGLAIRLSLVQQIHEQKRVAALPLFDRSREKEVQQYFADEGAKQQLPPLLIDQFLRLVFNASHDLQEEQRAACRVAPTDGKKILLVGGRGKMGRFFDELFTARGHTTAVLERDDPIDSGAIAGFDLVIVSAPLEITAALVQKIGAQLPETSLLCDLGSLKEEVCNAYKSGMRCETLGLHPMFGPTVRSLRRQKIICCPLRSGPQSEWLRSELTSLGAELHESTPEAHDRMMAIIQVLIHFTQIALGQTLSKSGLTLEETLRFTSPIYRLELAIIGRIFAQDPALYAHIQGDNRFGKEYRGEFSRTVSELNDALARGDTQLFMEEFNAAKRYFADFSREALRLSDGLIEHLVQQP